MAEKLKGSPSEEPVMEWQTSQLTPSLALVLAEGREGGYRRIKMPADCGKRYSRIYTGDFIQLKSVSRASSKYSTSSHCVHK